MPMYYYVVFMTIFDFLFRGNETIDAKLDETLDKTLDETLNENVDLEAIDERPAANTYEMRLTPSLLRRAREQLKKCKTVDPTKPRLGHGRQCVTASDLALYRQKLRPCLFKAA